MSCPRCEGPLTVRDEIDGRDVCCRVCGFRPTRTAEGITPEEPEVWRATFSDNGDGCSIAERCEACPLPDCAWGSTNADVPKVLLRNHRIVARLAEGGNVAQVAKELGVAERTVYRVGASASRIGVGPTRPADGSGRG